MWSRPMHFNTRLKLKYYLSTTSTYYQPHRHSAYQLLIHLLEQVQRRVTRQIFQLKDLSYSERLRSHNLPSLLCRRHRMDMIIIYKITQGLSGCHLKNFICLQETMDLKSTNITVTLMSGNILFLKG